MNTAMVLIATIGAILTTMIVIWLRSNKLRADDSSATSQTASTDNAVDLTWRARFSEQRLESPPPAGDWLTARPEPETDILNALEHLAEISGPTGQRMAQLLDCGLDPARLVDLIARDPELQRSILATVNSPLYQLARPINSSLEAISLLGSLEIRNMIVKGWISELLDPESGMDEEMAVRQWRHGFAVSRVAYALASAHDLPQPAELSAAALLHDVGKRFTLPRWPEAERSHLEQMPFSRYEYLVRERQWLGGDHGWLSGEMVRLWGLQSQWSDLIARHHLPSYTGPTDRGDSDRALATLHLADLLVHLSLTETAAAGYRAVTGWIELISGEERFDSLLSEPVLGALAAEQSWQAEMADRESTAGCRHQPVRWAA